MNRARICFAYGSNMDLGQMRARCPAARPDGIGSVAGWRFLINERGVATITAETGARVHGLLWLLTSACEACQGGWT